MKFTTVLLLVAVLVIPARAEILEQVLVKVNGDILTKTDLEQRQIAALRERLKERVDAEAMKNDAELKKALLEITPDLLVNAIDEMLLMQLGREKGYKLSDDQFKSWLENLRKEQSLQDDQKFQSALRQEGMSVDDLRKNVEKQFLLQRVRQDEVGSKLTITEEEARQFYLAHKAEFAEPATVTLREILVEIPAATQKGQAGINVGSEDEAAQKIAAIRVRAAAGEDFGKLAAEASDSPSKANGGLIGPLPTSDLSESLRTTLESMKPGEITQPVRSARGFQLLKLETLKTAAIQPFESVRDLVADRVHQGREQAELQKFLARIRSQALIEWKNADLKRLYEQRVAAGNAPSN
ncbi:MAG: peptidylprolyl isomerase [Vicinamibacterales bacterium]